MPNIAKQLDLNLLKAFVVTYNEKKLRRAAQKLLISPPSLSVKISKLNSYFDETLFVKTPEGFMPTPFADSLFYGVNELLTGIEDRVNQVGYFVPAQLNETLKIALGRHQIAWLTPRLYRRLKELAPNCNFIADAYGSVHMSDLLDSDVDLIVEFDMPVQKVISSFEVGTHEWEFVVRKDHPLNGRVELNKLVEYEIGLLNDSTLPHGIGADFLKDMSKAGTPVKFSFSTPSFAAMLEVVQGSDIVCSMFRGSFLQHQDKLKRLNVEHFNLSREVPVNAYVHKKNRHSKKHQWLIGLIREEFRNS